MKSGKSLQELQLLNCVKVLERGETLLYPTDTIWGLGCDATDEEAVSKIYRIKGRSEDKSFIILVSSVEMLQRYVKELPPMACDLLQAMSDTPLTVIYPQSANLPSNVHADDGSIAIRLVRNIFCAQLIERFGKPIVSTSANLSGEPSPLCLADISEQLINDVDHVAIVEDSPNRELRPSRIIKLEKNGMFRVIRD
ncbi:MAG: L-threonylcarbamoyladenylate synthase [Bacteroides sp.]|nr:L-threonylcarbamoyladenylate synthase [Bacteroides sp.]MCM1086191.1 L-threonylcarbamoyladenylate synthase [Bacteroides sp.]